MSDGPVTAGPERCPRCHSPTLFTVTEELPIKVPYEHAGKIVARDAVKQVPVRVCSNPACGLRSDDD